MNKVILMGRATKDPDVRYSQGGENPMAIARVNLAVDRRGAKKEGSDQPTADFIPLVAFGRTGEFFERYIRKGTKIVVTGRIQTGSYTNKDGVKVYTTEVVVEEVEFAESKNAQGGSSNNASAATSAPTPNAVPPAYGGEGFMNIPDGIEEELPFN